MSPVAKKKVMKKPTKIAKDCERKPWMIDNTRVDLRRLFVADCTIKGEKVWERVEKMLKKELGLA